MFLPTLERSPRIVFSTVGDHEYRQCCTRLQRRKSRIMLDASFAFDEVKTELMELERIDSKCVSKGTAILPSTLYTR